MKTESNQNNAQRRYYAHKSLEIILLIKHAQKLGFDLDEIRVFLAFWNKKNMSY
jgi:DNA-binding transcriptional MerR regulator